MSDDFPWQGPPCPDCGRELNSESVQAGESIRVAYSCPEHGLISIIDPFDENYEGDRYSPRDD